jgi:hypothetical protein
MNTSYSDFLVTHLPIFSGVKDLLEADDWLRTTESKFGLLHYTEYQKTLYVAQQLRGPIGAWWESYTAALPADHHVSWDEFRVAFRGHHMSTGTMCHKLSEFLDLRQGNHSVYEYTQEFNNLAQYGGHHIDTDEKKAKLYHKGLTIQLQDRLILSLNLSYNNLASAATDQEGTMRAYEAAEDKKRKRTMPGPTGGSCSGAPLKYLMVYSSSSTAAPILHRNNRWQLGHHSRLRQLGTRATTMERLGTLPRFAARRDRAIHHALHCRW